METVLKNKSFDFEVTLQYKDTLTAIDLDDVTDITILIRHQKTRETLIERKLSDDEVEIITANSGICAVHINGADTANARSGAYEYVATVDVANTDFDNDDADHAGFGNAFILAR